MSLEPSRDLVLTKLQQCFPDEGAAGEALALLDTYSGDTPKGQARVQLAVLKQCNGDLDQLRQLVDLTHTDYRDVLVGARVRKPLCIISQQPIEYARPQTREPRNFSQAAKWTMIILGLVVAAIVVFVVLLIRYVMSIGPLDSH